MGVGVLVAVSAGLSALWVAPILDPMAFDPQRRSAGFLVGAGVSAALGAALAVVSGAWAERRIWVAAGGWCLTGSGVGLEWAWLVVAGVLVAFGALVSVLVAPNAERPPGSLWLALWGSGVAVVAIVIVIHVLNHSLAPGWEEGRPYRRPLRRRLLARRSRRQQRSAVSPAHLWHRAAVAEAQSVPTFEVLADRLAAVGAPSRLVDRCRRAAADEARHAALCARLARHHGAGPEPAPVVAQSEKRPSRVRVGWARRLELGRLAADSLVDGLAGEGFAAARLRAGAATTDRVAARLQRSIVRDEQAHAALAAEVVGWCVGADPQVVAPSLRLAARRLHREVDAPADHRRFDDADLASVGLVPVSVAADLWDRQRGQTLAHLDATLAAHERFDPASSSSGTPSSEPSSPRSS